MRKTLINSTTKVFVNNIDLPDDWTGKPQVGEPHTPGYIPAEWSIPDGHELVDLPATQGETWNGASFDKRVYTEFIITFDQFEGRFTTAEWDDATDYVYETDLTTGKPKRRALIQGLARAQTNNEVDILHAKVDAFMSALVSGGILTSTRKDEILES